MKQELGTGARYWSWGDHWGWHIGISRYGVNISTPLFTLKLERRTKWYGERACLVCGLGHSGAHPDPCLGELPGVTGACCGHGDRTSAYIGWGLDGPTLREFIVDDGSWKLDMEDWVPEELPEKSQSVMVGGINVYIYDDYEYTAEDLQGLGEMLVAMAKDQIERNQKIHRAVHG